jgi:threonine/homoserine/homoserine lactone efflux protein
MFGTQDLWLFIITGLALNILPGPDSLYIVGRSVSQGMRAGSLAALGIGAGTLVHILAAACGLSAILATSATAFTLVKLAGALYLLYLGVNMLLTRAKPTGEPGLQTQLPRLAYRRIFAQGFVTNLLNPKVALFFLAFVPQFIALDAPNKALSFVFLGLVFNFNGMLWAHFLVWSSASIGQRVKTSSRFNLWLTRASGGLFGYFGIKLALSQQG